MSDLPFTRQAPPGGRCLACGTVRTYLDPQGRCPDCRPGWREAWAAYTAGAS